MNWRIALFAAAALFLLGAQPAGTADARQQLAANSGDTIKLPVLRRTIARYETITENDIAWTETALRRVPRAALTDPAALIGMAARRRLNPDRAILARDVQIPLAIRKGDLVAIVYTTPFMTLTARGRALQDAAAGAPIRTLNAHSKRTIEATAIAPGIVATRPISHEELAEMMR
jgi:flagella basal body P-ring formation protein FlgA